MNIKIIARYYDREFKIQVQPHTTVGELQFKLRKFLKIHPEEAVFLFFQKGGIIFTGEALYPGNMMLIDIYRKTGKSPIVVNVMKENTFGSWSRMYISTKIKKIKDLFVVTITYSYYGLYHYDEMSIHESLAEANKHIIDSRCGSHISYEIK
jgi:hypothetical protein